MKKSNVLKTTAFINQLILVLSITFVIGFVQCQKYLTTRGTYLVLNGEKVFLSGMNQAWVHYAYDFGNGGYEKSKTALYKTLQIIHDSGGNSLRVWLHVNGQSTPEFDSDGNVIGPGKDLIADLQDFLTQAQKQDILVNICLWNGAVEVSRELRGLIMEDSKLTSYINNALIPLVNALSRFRSLASWEIINEPEGSIATGMNNTEPCFDTSDKIQWGFADWTNSSIPLYNMLRFIGQQADAIHKTDKKALVSVGIWTFKSIATNIFSTNYYSDRCLHLASGSPTSYLDYYQVHTYEIAEIHIYMHGSPFNVNMSFYESSKPIIIGEFSSKRGAGMTSPEQFLWAYTMGYSGAWSWSVIGSDSAADSVAVQRKGVHTLKNKNNQTLGGRVNISLNNYFVKDLNFAIIL